MKPINGGAGNWTHVFSVLSPQPPGFQPHWLTNCSLSTRGILTGPLQGLFPWSGLLFPDSHSATSFQTLHIPPSRWGEANPVHCLSWKFCFSLPQLQSSTYCFILHSFVIAGNLHVFIILPPKNKTKPKQNQKQTKKQNQNVGSTESGILPLLNLVETLQNYRVIQNWAQI